MKAIHKKILRATIATAITAGIFVFLFRRISFAEVAETIKNTEMKFLIPALIISLVSNTVLVSYRWKLILDRIGRPISFKEALFVKMGSRIFPLKTNEISRAVYLKRLKDISYPDAIFSIISEYIFSTMALLLFIIIGLATPMCLPAKTASAEGMNASGGLAGLFAIGVFGLGKIRDRDLRKRWKGAFKEYLVKFGGLLRDKRILSVSIVYWICDLIDVYLLSCAVQNPLPVSKIMLFVPIVVFIGGIHVTIGGLGTRELVLVYLFSPYGPMAVLLGLSFLYYFAEQIFPTLVSVSLSGIFVDRLVCREPK